MTRKRLPCLSAYGVTWSANKRIATVVVIITALLAVAATAAWFAGADHSGQSANKPSHAGSSAPSGKPSERSAGSGSVPKPAQIAEPVAFAKAAAAMLWSYDTRDTSRNQQLAGMRGWMTEETKYADWASVSGQVPAPLLWSRMSDQGQHASGTVSEGHYPGAFKQALAEDPSAITEAYVYVVTVNGKQKIAWKKGGSGAEERAVTLAVQCRPNHDCRLAAIAPSVTQ